MINKKYFLLLAFFVVLFCSPPLFSKTFENSYIKFTIPNNWDCQLRSQAYVCRHKVAQSCKANNSSAECKKQIKKSKEAIIVMAAKEKSPVDTMPTYFQNLREPRKITRGKKSSSQSRVIHTKNVKIKNQQWVDGMHLSSELPLYYTRYLAAIKGDVAVLVTFNAHKLSYTQYSSVFFKSIKSLEITTKSSQTVKKYELGSQILSRPLDLPDDLLVDSGDASQDSQGDDTSQYLFLLAFLLATIGVYVWIKGRRK